jgi:hypothetical protein
VNALNYAARHRANIGAPVPANFGLVAQTAQGDAHELASGRTGDGLSDAGLTGPRRTDKAQDGSLYLSDLLLHGQVFQNTLFDLGQAVVVLDQRPLCGL